MGLLKEAFWRYRGRFIITVILGFLAGLFGGLGIGAIIPLFSFMAGPANGIADGSDFITEKIKMLFDFFNIGYNLPILIALMVSLFLLKAIITFLSFYMTEKVAVDYEKETRKKLFKKTIMAGWPFLSEQKIGYLESTIMHDTHVSSGILTALTNIIMIATSIIMYAFIAVNISAPITFLTLGLGIALFFFLKPFFYKIRKLGEKFGESYRKISNHIGEQLIGAKAVKANASENEVAEIAEEEMEYLKKTTLKMNTYNKIPGSFLEPLGIIFISGLFLFYFYFRPGFNIASFAVIVYIVQKEVNFMQSINARFSNINGAIPHLQAVLRLERKAEEQKETDTGREPFGFNNKIVIKNLSFSYGKDKIIKNINLTINRGEMLGLIGPSGAGKTTLVDILLRLLEPKSGSISIDGKDMRDVNLKSWRKKIGYVPQDAFLLNDSIENNIRFYDGDISHKDIEEASKMANIFDFISKLPDRFQTKVGERGVRLSGGQKQRIALARALAKKPEVLILDEATSAMDNESEAMIQKSIDNLSGKITVLAIAHRLSTVTRSDRLLVLENGQITEDGKPSELLKDRGSYFFKVYNIRK